MNNQLQGRVILFLSILLSVLLIIISSTGLFVADFYSQETLNWQTQAIGQDIIDLFVVTPFLLVTAILAYKNNRVALLLWSGVLFYLIYTFVIYCFGVHFNKLFVLYCMVLGISFYLFLYFLLFYNNEQITGWFSEKVPRTATAIYLLIIGILFYLLWLATIIPSIINNITPHEITETGLPVNPVHALDLSVCLPGFVLIALLLLKKNRLGYLLAPAMLVFCTLMDITIGELMVVMNYKGLENSPELTIIMGLMALISLLLLITYLRSLKRSA